MLVYQIGGESGSSALPGWKRVHVAGIHDMRIIGEHFVQRSESASDSRRNFNTVVAQVHGLPPERDGVRERATIARDRHRRA